MAYSVAEKHSIRETLSKNNRVIAAGIVFTGVPGQVIRNGAVAIAGKRIEWVGSDADLPAQYRSWPYEQYPDSTVLPGLVEAHAHLGTEWREQSEPDVIDPLPLEQGWNVLQSLHEAQQLALVGVTAVQSLGSRYYADVVVREAIEQGLVAGPRIVAAGAILTPTAGHGWKNGSEVDSESEILRAIREHHKAGVNVIKIAGTGGFLSKGSAQWKPQFSIEELKIATREAHRLGKRVAVHAHGTLGIEYAVEAGVDFIAHASFVSDDGVTCFVPELADRIAQAGIYVDVASARTYPPVADEPRSPRAYELYRHGVKIVAGHDVGIYGVTPSYYVYGLRQLAKQGIPTEEILISATSRAAAAIGLAGITGVLQSGYEADIIVVEGNPLQDLVSLEKLQQVILRGDRFLPQSSHDFCDWTDDFDYLRNNTGVQHALETRFAYLQRQQMQQW
ncbi:amidohydrolase family protein [Bifidobacterium olomucense]|uniref:Amidohydrolase family protein n=1 Tax=Bifidobacterium olomucense TaxID=2675324 RepID=A0A7Y0HXF8_9BIFI|nr:amidohydrolase family protein [Bifidobacterium sp. DSM 109959]NMM98658.1 amidohydrolase family protein [Bifidobacterium sp. DSM 109959]